MPTREYKVFHGVGAVVAEVKSHHLLSVLAITREDIALDFSASSRRFDVDLRLSPGRVSPSDWSKVQFDDRGVTKDGVELSAMLDPTQLNLGITTIGSGRLEDQTRGGFVGGIYIESDYYNKIYDDCIGSTGVLWPTNYCKLAEITTITYSNSPDNGEFANKRYHGFLAMVTDTSATALSVIFDRARGLGAITFDRDGTDFDNNPPPEACGSATSLVNAPKDTKGVLFVRLERAAELQLTDPKLPIGLGLGDDALARRRSRAIQAPAAMERVNISLLNPDPALAQVLDKIDGEARVSGAFPTSVSGRTTAIDPGVVGVVRTERARAPKLTVAVDLIAHAKHGVLQFGNWVINDTEQASTQLLQAWEVLSPSEIRLLGCNTALTAAGQAAIRHLKTVFGVPVYGATTPLYARDFGSQGLIVDGVLVECDNMPAPLPSAVSDEIVNQWHERFNFVPGVNVSGLRNALRAETLDEAMQLWTTAPEADRWSLERVAPDRDIDALFDSLGPGFVTAPGLLATPEFEWLYAAGSLRGVPMFYRVTALLEGTFLRIYVNGYPDGVLFRRPHGI